MATIKPVRTSLLADAEYSAWWDPNGVPASLVRSTDGFLRMGYNDVVGGATARIAIKFKDTLPAWTSIGNITEVSPIIQLFTERKCKQYGGGDSIGISLIADAWDLTSTVAYMEGTVVPGISATKTGFVFPKRGWKSYDLDLSGAGAAARTYGILISYHSTAELEAYLLQDPAPRAAFHFQYDLDDTLSSDSEERFIPSAAALLVAGGRGGEIYQTAEIKASDILSEETDITFSTFDSSARSGILFTGGGWPESWTIKGGNRSAITIPVDENAEDAMAWRGLELLQKLYAKPSGKAAEIIGQSRSLILSATQHLNGKLEIAADDLLVQAFGRKPFRRDELLGYEGVNWLAENSIEALFDILVSGSGLRWEHIFYDDFVWLARRFGAVWPTITIPATDLTDNDLTVGDLVSALARRYSLCVSRTAGGSCSIWHPAVYRPSFQYLDIDLDEYRFKDLSISALDDQVPYRRVTCDYGGVSGNSFGPVDLDPGFDVADRSYDLGTLYGSNELLYEDARDAICEQLAQRICTPRRVIKGTLPPSNITLQRGDQIRASSVSRGYDEMPFLITETALDSGMGSLRIEGIYHPHALGLHSCFSAGEVQGIYRWWDWFTGAADLTNRAWEGSAGSFTVSSSITSHLPILWEGSGIQINTEGTITGPNNWGVTNTAGITDLVDFWTLINGALVTDLGGGATEDNTHTWVMKIYKSARPNHAVCLGFYRDNDGTYGRCCARNKAFLGRTRDITAVPIVWDEIVYSQPGLGTDDTGSAYTTIDSHALAIQWTDSTIRGYLNGIYFGSLTLAKADYDRTAFRAPNGEIYLGPLRWLKRTSGLFIQAEMYSRNGRDPFYK